MKRTAVITMLVFALLLVPVSVTANDQQPEDKNTPEVIQPLINILLPNEVSFVLNPYELGGREQIYSENFEVYNKSNIPVRLIFTDLQIIFANDTDFEIVPYKFDSNYKSDLKALHLVMNFDRPDIDDVVVSDIQTDEVEILLNPAYSTEEGNIYDSIGFSFNGNVNYLKDNKWEDGDVKLNISYTIIYEYPEDEDDTDEEENTDEDDTDSDDVNSEDEPDDIKEDKSPEEIGSTGSNSEETSSSTGSNSEETSSGTGSNIEDNGVDKKEKASDKEINDEKNQKDNSKPENQVSSNSDSENEKESSEADIDSQPISSDEGTENEDDREELNEEEKAENSELDNSSEEENIIDDEDDNSSSECEETDEKQQDESSDSIDDSDSEASDIINNSSDS